eukprot:3692800-Pleurochrysis_carterae.AAC.3
MGTFSPPGTPTHLEMISHVYLRMALDGQRARVRSIAETTFRKFWATDWRPQRKYTQSSSKPKMYVNDSQLVATPHQNYASAHLAERSCGASLVDAVSTGLLHAWHGAAGELPHIPFSMQLYSSHAQFRILLFGGCAHRVLEVAAREAGISGWSERVLDLWAN